LGQHCWDVKRGTYSRVVVLVRTGEVLLRFGTSTYEWSGSGIPVTDRRAYSESGRLGRTGNGGVEWQEEREGWVTDREAAHVHD
ncbi:MAG: hypothetical protein VXW31_03355, partial [Planctomycetota bacterium]|nr:hypothetical protein [Planctomycetota bacterium]